MRIDGCCRLLLLLLRQVYRGLGPAMGKGPAANPPPVKYSIMTGTWIC
jgi:hypothetical protein